MPYPTGNYAIEAVLARVMDAYWWGKSVTNRAIPPIALNNEAITAVNAAGTGVVELMRLTAGDKVQIPNLIPLASRTVSTITTAGAATYTAAQILGGLLLRDPNGANRSDVTPTAALLVAAIPGAVVGQSFEFQITNTADAAETITVTAGSGATLSGTMTIAQNASRRFLVVLTNVTAAAEAYTVYSIGSFTT